MHGQAKVRGVDGVLADGGGRLVGVGLVGVGGTGIGGIGIGMGTGGRRRARLLHHLPHVRLARNGDLVKVLGAAHDERVLDRGVAGEGAGEDGAELGVRDTEDEAARSGGVDERAEEVEEGAVREGAADGGERGEARVVVGREEEGEVRVLRGWDVCVCRGGRERAPERLEEVGRSRGGRRRAVTVLRGGGRGRGWVSVTRYCSICEAFEPDLVHSGTCTGGYDGGCGADIKGIVAVTTGTDNIDHSPRSPPPVLVDLLDALAPIDDGG